MTEPADGLREGDLRDGALFGFTSARPAIARDGLSLALHPAMADRVLATVLPRIDQDDGGLRGVPGLRIVPRRGGPTVADHGDGDGGRARRRQGGAGDWLILRQGRAAMDAGSAEDRVRIGMRLAEALGGGPAAEAAGQIPEQPGGEVVRPRP
ncbi:hypothetical protein ACFY7Y_07195 [Streptomyces virginiae]|uniref:hypothetical protein n=1 Tax=Streptomyces virginiae TaxID=1961 RepID=UPI0036CE0995